ncbi:hypothetical protein [Flagellimonas nanhaiensis]|uniref:hypothetical protein n=1 Tax=Flagellimonas nanhaiensis TaxID=2292706 RepID=UPI0011C05D75|nr:hypothetical protein [Allomuricauda nanhaiensis]
MLTVIWLSQLSLYVYHILTTHTDSTEGVELSVEANGIKEAGSSCDLCTHFITKAADLSLYAIILFLFTPFFFAPYLKENNLPFLFASKNFQRGPPQ